MSYVNRNNCIYIIQNTPIKFISCSVVIKPKEFFGHEIVKIESINEDDERSLYDSKI